MFSTARDDTDVSADIDHLQRPEITSECRPRKLKPGRKTAVDAFASRTRANAKLETPTSAQAAFDQISDLPEPAFVGARVSATPHQSTVRDWRHTRLLVFTLIRIGSASSAARWVFIASACFLVRWVFIGTVAALAWELGVFLTPVTLKGVSVFARSSHAAASAGMFAFIAR